MSASSAAVPAGVAPAPGLATRVGGGRWPPAAPPALAVALSFVALAGYGLARWQTMLAAGSRVRLLVLLVLAGSVLVAGIPARRGGRAGRVVLAAAVVTVALAMVFVAGAPLSWLLHARLALGARELWRAVAQLPDVTVPYRGGHPAVAAVIVLGAGWLLLAAAVSLAVGAHGGALRWRLGAAAPLLIVAALPSLLGPPRFSYLHGLILFGLLVALLSSRRRPARRVLATSALIALAGGGGLLATTAIDHVHFSLDFGQLVGDLSTANGARFDWQQTYGPIGMAPDSRPVLRISASRPAYWKAEDLDVFNGTGWSLAAGAAQLDDFQDPTLGVSARHRRQWTDRLTVRDLDIQTRTVIAAGAAEVPRFADPRQAVLGAQLGTWTVGRSLVAGDRYTVEAYVPRPNPVQLRRAREPSGTSLTGQLTVGLPGGGKVEFAPYGSELGTVGGSGVTGGSQASLAADRLLLADSPYEPVYELAQRLEAPTPTAYAYTEAVEHHLQRGFVYERNPPRSRYPIIGFLLHTRRGYCQQYAGAMALLLRMGGVPARVAVGFLPGSAKARPAGEHRRTFTVTARDAHAWVEAWFNGYGWVTFDPTVPGPVTAALTPTPITGTGASELKLPTPPHRQHLGVTRAAAREPGTHPHRHPGAATPWALVALLGALPLAGAGILDARRRRRRGASRPEAERAQDRLGELERALARCGRPLRGGQTLLMLERELRFNPEAAAYVAALRQARFATSSRPPNALQRRALRRYLRAGGGVVGRVRALLALPPWRLD